MVVSYQISKFGLHAVNRSHFIPLFGGDAGFEAWSCTAHLPPVKQYQLNLYTQQIILSSILQGFVYLHTEISPHESCRCQTGNFTVIIRWSHFHTVHAY